MTPLSQASTTVILSSVAVTLLLLRNKWIPLHQSSNFIQSPLNHPRSKTIVLSITVCSNATSAVNISSISGIASSVVLSLFKVYSLVILNNPSTSDSASILS